MPRSKQPDKPKTDATSQSVMRMPDPRQTEFPIAPPPLQWEVGEPAVRRSQLEEAVEIGHACEGQCQYVLHSPRGSRNCIYGIGHPGEHSFEKRADTQLQTQPQSLPAMPLYQIDRELAELLALEETLLLDREEAAKRQDNFALDAATEALTATGTQIAAYIRAHAAKVDGIAYTIREFLSRGDIESAEAERHRKRSAAWKAKADRLKDYVLRFMHSVTPPIKRLEVAGNRLRAQVNGGLQPLEVTDVLALPVSMRRYQMRLTGEQFLTVCEWATAVGDADLLKTLAVFAPEPDTDAIRLALSRRIVCPQCKGVLDVVNGCAKCNNEGTVLGEVPGARLLERGQHLRVE